VIFSLASAGFIATVCLSAWRAGWPRWLVYLGWAAVVAGALGVLFMPIIVVLAWYLAVGVVGLVHADEVEGVVA